VLKGLAQYLDAQEAAVTWDEEGTTGNVFLETLPPLPDVAVMLELDGGPSMPYEMQGVQLTVRGDGALAQRLYNLLEEMDGVTLADGTYVVGCIPVQGAPVHIGADESGRHEYTINLHAVTE
jgi:hypothetical protein